ncbi:lysyl endopeptidase [Gammaproteobacteria bacterium]
MNLIKLFLQTLGLFAWLMILPTGLWADSAPSAVYPGAQTAAPDHPSVLKSAASQQGGTWFSLPPLATGDQAVSKASPKGTGPMRIGSGRQIEALRDNETLGSQARWYPADDGGWLSALTVNSPGAVGMRLGIRVENLPDRAELRFFAPGNAGGEIVLVRGEGVNRLIGLNLGDPIADPQQARIYWSPVIEGEAIAVEFYLPPGISPQEVSIAIPQASHLFRAPIPTAMPHKVGESDTCEVDVMCASADWQNKSRAVALMVFSDSSGSYLCTGTLLNDNDTTTWIPYFLSANHCISTQSTASTLETYWFYRASSCSSGVLSSSTVHLTGGATLLYAVADTDTSFMRMNSNPPSGALFSGWDSATLTAGTSITGLHHPSGDLQKISKGTVTSYVNCFDTGGEGFSCSPANSTTGNHLEITWNSGVTEGGSSGSGLFSNSSFKLIGGQLHGGSSYCSSPTDPDYYGRFDLAYKLALSQWLNGGSSTNQTLTVVKNGSGTVTSNPSGIDCGSTCSASFASGTNVALTAAPASGYAFTGWGGDCSGSGSCTVSMTAAKNVAATFTAATTSFALSVTKSGTGSGTLTSNPSGINCGSSCSASFASGTSVVLTAAPASGSAFTGWGGDCSGTGSCTVSMTVAKNVSAVFSANTGGNADVVLLQTTSPSVMGAGPGDDTYILTPYVLSGTENITISDAQGSNLLQLVGGLSISKSDVASTALRLTLINGAQVTILGANAFLYDVGGNATAGINHTPVSFIAFASNTLGVTVPTSGTVTGGPVTITTP